MSKPPLPPLPFPPEEPPTRPDLRCPPCKATGKVQNDIEARPTDCAWCGGKGMLTQERLRAWEAVERAKKP